MKEVFKVLRTVLVETFVSQDTDFEDCPLFNREPMQVLQNWGDMIELRSHGDNPCCMVLDLLESMEKPRR